MVTVAPAPSYTPPMPAVNFPPVAVIIPPFMVTVPLDWLSLPPIPAPPEPFAVSFPESAVAHLNMAVLEAVCAQPFQCKFDGGFLVMIAFMFVFSFRVEFIDFFVVFIEDGGACANLIFQAAASDSTAFSVSEEQAEAAVAIFFFINVTDDESPVIINISSEVYRSDVYGKFLCYFLR